MMKDKQIIIEILKKRNTDAFNNPYHKFEYGRLLTAINSIDELVPPECFDSQIEEGKAVTDEEIEIEMNKRGMITAWDRMNGRTMAKWMRGQSRLSEPSMQERDELIKKELQKDYDSQTCSKCGGRTALVSGSFVYEPDTEPYNNGIEEQAKISDNDSWIHGYICDVCGNIQGLWHE